MSAPRLPTLHEGTCGVLRMLVATGVLRPSKHYVAPPAVHSVAEALLLLELGDAVDLQLLDADTQDELRRQAARRLGCDAVMVSAIRADLRGPILLAWNRPQRWALAPDEEP
jgi:hypothetical protein